VQKQVKNVCQKVIKSMSKSCQNFVTPGKKHSFLQQCAKCAKKMPKNRQMLLLITTMRKKSHPNVEKRDFQLKT
jgi:hypothetical protein